VCSRDAPRLGTARGVGRSTVPVDDTLLLDYGTAADDPPQFPVGDVDPDAAVASRGRRLPVAAQVEQSDGSVHADRDGVRSLLDDYRGGRVLVNHGDGCVRVAAELRDDGFDARAPELGETVTV
jgi:Cft2 family RNA processing exonuclease